METRSFVKWVGRTLAAFVALFAAACTDVRLPDVPAGADAATVPTPVRFKVGLVPLRASVDAATRTAPSVRKWQEGDVIQIAAVFSCKDREDSLEYCGYRYLAEADEWEPVVPNEELWWPVGAKSAKFTAYYIKDITGAFTSKTEETSGGVFLLGDIEEGTDPLYCTFSGEYGESVNLNFRHLCTHLTLNEVKKEMSDIYWLYGNASGEGKSPEIPNAYELKYNPTKKELEFRFLTSEKSTTRGAVTELGEGDHYVVSRKKSSDEDWVDFYLAPYRAGEGETRTSDVIYTYGKDCKLNYVNNHPYLSFTSDDLDKLEAGVHYELSVERSTGIVPEPQTDFPDKPGSESGYVHIPDLLYGMENGNDVSDVNGQLVLKSTGEAYPRLLRDVDFHNFNPIDYINGEGDFDPENKESIVPENFRTGPHKDWKMPRLNGKMLDGDYHSFLHVAYPIFYNIESSEIYNLAIRDSKVNITVDDIQEMDRLQIQGAVATEGATNTEFGILANIFSGKLSRFLLENVDMTVHLNNELWTASAGITYSIGCVAGKQSTSSSSDAERIERVELRGNVNLTVTTDGGTVNNRQDICAGVIVGQSGASIAGITCTEGLGTGTPIPGKCTIILPINGENNVKAGGLVGKEVMMMQDVSCDVVVDASRLRVAQCYVGGLVGEIVNENANFGSLLDCTANVTVTGGVSRSISNVTYSYSYCGGIAGKASHADIHRIYIRGSVKGGTETEAQTSNPQMLVFATGGGFGYVTESQLKDCRTFADVTGAYLMTSGFYCNNTGRFVGMTSAADGYEENKDGNSAASSETLGFVGASNASEPGGGR